MTEKRELHDRLLTSDGKVIEGILRLAVADALLDHKRAGHPIAVWQDGKVVWIPADEIPVKDPVFEERVRQAVQRVRDESTSAGS